nr:nucleoside deaminase [Pseudomonadota bacterium]
VGAVITRGAEPIAEARNAMRQSLDPTAHAEMAAMRAAAAALGSPRLDRCDLWVTLEPCAMCAGAISLARIQRLYFGAADSKGGAVLHGPRLFSQPTCHHAPEVYPGIGEAEAGEMLRDFFRERRAAADRSLG